MGEMISRKERVLTDEDITKISNTVQSWRNGKYEDIAGFSYEAQFEEIKKNNFSLSPGRYVGFQEEIEEDELFEEKMEKLSNLLKEQQEQGSKLDKKIAENLKRIGFEF